jgi:parallel beta-helix repeat protein
VQGEVRICPGHYRIPDPAEKGVIIAAASGTRIDLTGVTLESGDSVPARFVGIGIASRGVDGVTVQGGAVRGYHFGIRIEGGRGHRISAIEVSGSRRQDLRSTAERPDTADRLDVATPAVFARYGAGLVLQGVEQAIVVGIVARGSQNGIGLVDTRESYLADNDVSGNNGWGIHLWRSSHNLITRNQADHTLRCATAAFSCGAAAILLREASDSNIISENDLTSSSIGVLLAGPGIPHSSVGNLIYRNNAAGATGSGFEAALCQAAQFVENRADSAQRGFRLDRVSRTTVRGNTVIGAREVSIQMEQGSENSIAGNVLLGSRVGILIVGATGYARSRGVRIDDNAVGGTQQAIVLRHASQSRVRGNVLDQVGDALLIDGAGYDTEVTGNIFLRATGWYVQAPDLAAGGNYWATTDAAAAAARVKGRITVLPWKPASAAGY